MINILSPVQTDATVLANNSQHCWMFYVASVCTPCCMLLDVVACCCAKFETGQTFQPTTPNISFVPWSPKRSATMLDPFAQLFQHCWGHARSLRMVYNDCMGCILPTMHRRSQHCCELLHPFGHHCQHALNNVCTQPYTSIRLIPCRLSVKETNGVIFYFYNYYCFGISASSVKTFNKTSDRESKSGYFSFFWSLLKGREKTKQNNNNNNK